MRCRVSVERLLWTSASILVAFLVVPAATGEFLSRAGEGIELSLEEALELGLERNRDLTGRRLDREARKLSTGVAGDRFRPVYSLDSSVEANGETGFADAGVRVSLGVPTGGRLDLRWNRNVSGDPGRSSPATLGFSQPLLKGAGTAVGTASLRKARIEERIGLLEYRQAAADLVSSIVISWRGLIQAHSQVEISEASLRRARDQLEVTRALIRAGRVAQREITRSEASIANRELALLRARNGLESANLALMNLLDLEDTARIRPRNGLGGEPVPTPAGAAVGLEDRIGAALRHRTEIRIAAMAVEIAGIDLEVAENNRLPDLSFAVRLSRDEGTGRSERAARLDMTIPLNDRSPELQLLQARNGLDNARRDLEELRESIRLSVRQAVNDVEVGLRLIDLARKARTLAAENLAIEQIKFGQGLSSTFEVAASEDGLVAAQNDELDATIGWLNALTRLDGVTGLILESRGIALEAVGE
ncbi:MAG: TolC family protein [Gammaproteobacteria bacterium]|nr:TolC family protein [Gammaproteobacteria bacterium]